MSGVPFDHHLDVKIREEI